VNEEPKDWIKRTSYGNSYEDFQAHQEALKAQEGK